MKEKDRKEKRKERELNREEAKLSYERFGRERGEARVAAAHALGGRPELARLLVGRHDNAGDEQAVIGGA